jgi:hypothetical protein
VGHQLLHLGVHLRRHGQQTLFARGARLLQLHLGRLMQAAMMKKKKKQ